MPIVVEGEKRFVCANNYLRLDDHFTLAYDRTPEMVDFKCQWIVQSYKEIQDQSYCMMHHFDGCLNLR